MGEFGARRSGRGGGLWGGLGGLKLNVCPRLSVDYWAYMLYVYTFIFRPPKYILFPAPGQKPGIRIRSWSFHATPLWRPLGMLSEPPLLEGILGGMPSEASGKLCRPGNQDYRPRIQNHSRLGPSLATKGSGKF